MKIIPDIIDWRDELKRRKSAIKDYDYVSNFHKSVKRTKQLKLEIPKIKFDDNFSSHNNGEPSKQIIDLIQQSVYVHPQELIAFNCFEFAIRTQTALKEKLNIDSVVTLGSIGIGGTKKFYESFTKLKYRLNHPEYETEMINLHAWLTLPDWYIIDVTVLSALKFCGEFQELDYRNFNFFDGRKQDNLCLRLSYHPMLVGSDYLTKIKVKTKEFEIEYV